MFLTFSEELVNDLHHATGTDEGNVSRRPSRMSAGIGSNTDDTKSVRFASSSPTPSRRKLGLSAVVSGHQDDMNTISTIRSLLQYVKLHIK